MSTAVWLHHFDPNEAPRWELHKNVACSLEQVVETALHKEAAVWPPNPISQTIRVRRTRQAGHCWKRKDELISNVLLWKPTHGHANVGRRPRTYIDQLCEDAGCCVEDLLGTMNDREGW